MKRGYKQTEIGVIPQEWEIVTAAEACALVVDCKNRTPPFVPDSEYAVVRTPNVRDGQFVLEDLRFTNEASYREWTARAVPEFGDILITREAPLGEVCAVPQDRKVCLGQRMMLYRPSRIKTNSTYLLYSLMSLPVRANLLRKMGGSTVGHVKVDDIRSLQVPLPALVEQRAIAEVLSDANTLLGALDRLIAKKRDLKQAVMQQLLSTQTRLPGFHGEWELKSFGDLASEIRDGTHQTPRYSASGVPFYSVENVTSGDFKNTKFISMEEHRLLTKSYKIEKGDILMTRIGSIGDCKLIDWEVDASFYVSLALLKINPRFSAEYICHYSKTASFAKEVELHSLQSAIPRKINLGPISDVRIRIPSDLSEQKAIAGVLSDMDVELAALEQRREKTRSLKLAMMQELLTGRTRLVSSFTNVSSFPKPEKVFATKARRHNWEFNEAVIIGALAKQFGTERWPLPRKRRVKLMYLLHRHAEGKAEGYLKKAAGPYNPATKYKGPEAIAIKNGYVREHNNGSYSGFVPAENVSQAQMYFVKWYSEAFSWLEQFRFEKTDELELLSTVDMAIEDLRLCAQPVDLGAVKEVIRNHPEWEAKLSRPIFSDANIARAINICGNLFPRL